MKIAMVHYHARPGGVTRVIERAVEALGARANCLVFSGEHAAANSPIAGRVHPVAHLGYESKPKPLHLLEQARSALGACPDLWHIHNHSLGKNPALCAEVAQLAEAGEKILLQIHDFAEDGRPANYKNLGTLHRRLYPIAPHIHYAALNHRDIQFLRAIGIPSEQLHLLPNAVDALAQRPAPRAASEPLYVYPCRAIRRKNIGEVLLWSAAMPHARFAITLAPKNPVAQPIYNGWVAFARELGLNVAFDVGAERPFEEIVARADAWISTSIAEGFGLAFLEPWLAGKPLVGRNLPEITADFQRHGLDLSALYERIGIPLTCEAWDIGAPFLEALETHVRAAGEAYGRPGSAARFERARAALVQDGTVDFGILSEPLQRIIIRAAQQQPDLFCGGLGDSTAQIRANRAVVEQAYGLGAYGDHLASIYQNILRTSPSPIRFADGQKLIDLFLDPARINLLRS